jgi:hypothetical protein
LRKLLSRPFNQREIRAPQAAHNVATCPATTGVASPAVATSSAA